MLKLNRNTELNCQVNKWLAPQRLARREFQRAPLKLLIQKYRSFILFRLIDINIGTFETIYANWIATKIEIQSSLIGLFISELKRSFVALLNNPLGMN